MENQVNANFIKAGNSTFTVKNENTGNRFTFKVKKADEDQHFDGYFVKVLTGQDNTKDYKYIGCIFPDGEFKITRASKVTKEAQSFKVFSWLNKYANNLPEFVKIYHEGRCGRCGRKLTVPESVKSGYGPECITRINH